MISKEKTRVQVTMDKVLYVKLKEISLNTQLSISSICNMLINANVENFEKGVFLDKK